MQERHAIRAHILNLIVAASMLLGSQAYGQSSIPDISFSVTRDGEFIQTDARVDLPVARDVAWAVLTDYERYPSFISSMNESKVVSRGPDGLVVEQKGRFSILFFSQKVEAMMLVSEHPPNVIESRSIGGDFRAITGRYELLQVGDRVRLSYLGRLAPNFSLPPVFGTSFVRYVLQRNFREMVDEILRRNATARQVLQSG